MQALFPGWRTGAVKRKQDHADSYPGAVDSCPIPPPESLLGLPALRAPGATAGPFLQVPRPHAQKKAPILGLTLCHYHLEILNNFLTRGPAFHFALDHTKYKVGSTWNEE